VDSQASTASYSVQERFFNRPTSHRTTGMARGLEGELTVRLGETPSVQFSTFKVDLRLLKSDEERRDASLREEWLESGRYPIAELSDIHVEGAPATYREGEEVEFKLLGMLRVHATSRPTTWTVRARLADNTVTGVATTMVNMSDFGFAPPEIAGVLKVEDPTILEVNFTAREAKS
jgi:polyisoprenoid-binding protein YceI